MNRQSAVMISVIIFMSHCLPLSASAECDPHYQYEIAPSDVSVQVSWSGWNVRLIANGWIGFVAPESRSDLMHSDINTDAAVDMLDRLLEIGFFYMQERYPSVAESLSTTSSGCLYPKRTQVMDGGEVAITLRVGTREHQVVMDKPFATAPGELVAWFEEFEVIVNREFFGTR